MRGWRLIAVLGVLAWMSVLALTTTSLATGSRAEWRAKVDPSVLAAANAGPTEFLIDLERKADLSPAARLRTKRAKGRFVYNRLRTVAAASQAPVVAELRRHGVEHRALWISNVVWVRAGTEALRAVAALPGVAHVYTAGGEAGLDRPVRANRPEHGADAAQVVGPSIAHVKANQAWALGYTGQGVTVASGDTGVRWTHSALKSKYRGWNGTTADHNYNWWDAVEDLVLCPSPQQQPCDDDTHGTHTTGTMVGSDAGDVNQVGMAPGAKWIACRNMLMGVGEGPLDYGECMQFFIAPTKLDGTAADPDRSPDVVNNSWGCVEACASPLLLDVLQASRAAGIVYVASAGNDGLGGPPPIAGCDTIVHPLARYIDAFTVGSTVVGATDPLSDFSSRGPVPPGPDDPAGHRKPDIVAPGSSIRSTTSDTDSSYGSLSGTSMAGPHVAGLVALVISAKPSLRGQVSVIENIIEQSAVHKTTDEGCGGDTTSTMPNNSYGWGRIDALAAVQLATGPTAVKLVSFTASRTRAGVNLRWRTGTGIGALGFNVWRSTSATGRYKKVNRSILPATTQVTAASYSYVDRRALGKTGFYKLELKNVDGPSAWAGPTRARS